MYYDMDGNPVEDVLEWGRLFEKSDRMLAKFYADGVEISTVWIGINMGFPVHGPPLIFETMIFGGDYDGWQDRYSTKDEAMNGHNRAIRMVIGE